MEWKNMTPAQRLCALYNASRPQGLGFLHFQAEDMTEPEAEILVAKGSYFDYLKGRIIKTDVCTEELNPRLYDRDNGAGAAEAAIAAYGVKP